MPAPKGCNPMDILNKLQFKNEKSVYIWNAPDEFAVLLTEWNEHLTVMTAQPDAPVPFLIIFVRDLVQLEQSKPALENSMDPAGLIWVAYPKKSSKNYQSDLSRDVFWNAYRELGLEPVRQIALNDDWSALRFRPGDAIKRK